MTEHQHLYIDGAWSSPAGTATITVTSPSTEDVIGSVPEASEADVDRAVAAARRAFDDPSGWAQRTPAERADVLERFAAALDSRAATTAAAVSSQNGMPLQIAQGFESVFPALLLRYYGAMVRDRDPEERRDAMFGGTTVVRHEPVGVVAAIVPWNFPQALAFLKIAPALAAGCTLVVKPAPETVLDVRDGRGRDRGRAPRGSPQHRPRRSRGRFPPRRPPGRGQGRLTGSTAAGRSIAETCGRLLRPVTLELGGKSAAIVLDDADLASNLEAFFGATVLNDGQTCFLSTRVLAPRSRYDEIVDVVTGLADSLVVGDALDPSTQVGPMVSARQRERVESYTAKGLAAGARLTAGGGRPTGHDRGSSSPPPSSPTSTTTTPSPRRRSSERSCPSSPTPTRTMRSGSPTTATTGWAGRCGAPTPRTPLPSHDVCAPVRSVSTPTPTTRSRRSEASRPAGSDGRWAPRAWPGTRS